jgi:site-specific recombinase XerD
MPRQPLTVAHPVSNACTLNLRTAGAQPSRSAPPAAEQFQTLSGTSPAVPPTTVSSTVPLVMATAALERASEEWLLDCEYRLHSPRTLDTRRIFLKNLRWFLAHRGYESCGTREMKEFFYYLRHGHEEGGRWGRKHLNKPARPDTVKDYWICLNSFFKWLVAEELLGSSPMEKIPKPAVRQEEKQPLSPAQVKALLNAARRSQHPRRDEAIVLLLLDTGIRSSELTDLKMSDVDLRSRQCKVLGKGNKLRIVHFGLTTGNALRLYLRQRSDENDDPLFLADKTNGMIRGLTRSGLQQLLERLGHVAGIKGRSCSPHVLRRTFAVTWLRNGANIFSLQAMLGHTDLRMTQRYLSLANADIAEQARQFSPADKLRNTRK